MDLRARNFESDFKFKTSKSSGAGGQHVNTTETKVELIFDLGNSMLLSDSDKRKIQVKLAGYINDKIEFRINSSESRSQSSNKESVIDKFYDMFEKALKKEKRRIPTKIPKVVKEDILKNKKLHSKKKQERRYKGE